MAGEAAVGTDVHVFTSAAWNYESKVRTLFDSIGKHHPEWNLHWALPDQLRPDIDKGLDVAIYSLADLEIPEWRGWAFCHDIQELATAIKGFALKHLLQRDNTKQVIYLDPDIVLFSRLDDILEALEHSSIVLTPHQIEPERSLDSIMDNEICSLKHGIYNLGFLGVANTEIGRTFADWWCKRLYHFCRADIGKGLFTDQRWIDLVPAFFEEVAIMRTPRHNVAPWNLTTRNVVRRSDGELWVGDERLGFYHFTGFDSGAHRIMAAKNAARNREVSDLIKWYEKQTGEYGKRLEKSTWAFASYDDGTPIGRAERILYRERIDLQRTFPNPFEASGFLAWCRSEGVREFPRLFEAGSDIEGILGMTATRMTPGWRAGVVDRDYGSVVKVLWRAGMNPGFGVEVVRRGWRILRNEGLEGIRRRVPGRGKEMATSSDAER